jgi:type I restriction enzyme, R subunit
MKQAIEEGFILDVLQNYTTYNTFYTLNKEISEDPKCKTNDAKHQIARYIELNETNVAQRTEIIIEHFRQFVMNELGGQAKAMVLTHYKENALTYYNAFKAYIKKKKYSDLDALVAFSGKVKLDGDEETYTEVKVNGFTEEQLPAKFDTNDFQILIVANKYQTGFDQPKLCAMYILKSLNGVNAVQALSRLNRICPPYKKKTFILDFVNSYEDMKKAFARYYTTTILSNTINPSSIADIEAKMDGYYVIDPFDIESCAKLMMKKSITAAEEKHLNFIFGKTEKVLKKHTFEEQKEILTTMRHFVRFYEFLLQATCYEDIELHKKYLFVSAFIDYVNIGQSGAGYDLRGKVKAINFIQKKDKEHKDEKLNSNPMVKLPTADDFGLTEEKKLSEIIAEINAKSGKGYDTDIVVKSILQIRDLMMKSEKLKTSAKNNTADDFSFAFFDNVDDVLIDGLEQNSDFFSLLLNNDEMKHQVLGALVGDIYSSLRQSK